MMMVWELHARRSMSALVLTLLLAVATPLPAAAQEVHAFNVAESDPASALRVLGMQAGIQILASADDLKGKTFNPVTGEISTESALTDLLAGTGLEHRYVGERAVALVSDDAPSVGKVRIAQATGAPAAAASGATQSNGGTSSGVTDSEPVRLEEVVVTAQKRSEKLLSVAAPVTALMSSTLARVEAVRLDDYASQVPGLNLFGGREGAAQLVIRGVTTGASNSTTTAAYIDDAPFGSSTTHALGGPSALDLDPGSLERIEVLRGPQGTLYGASALGGIVKYVTVPPSLTDFSGHVSLDGSTVDGGGQGFGVRGLINAPLVPNVLGLTLSAFDRRDPGYIDNPTLGEKNINSTKVDGGRVALLWKPTDSLSIDLSALLQDLSSQGGSVEWLNAGLVPVDGGRKEYTYTNEPMQLNIRLYNMTVSDDLGWGSVTSITSYQTEKKTSVTDATLGYGPIVQSILGLNNPDLGMTLPSHIELNKITQEVRVAAPITDRLDWQGGFFFTHESSVFEQDVSAFDIPTQQPVSLGVDIYHGSDSETYREEAIFGDLTYHFTSKFNVLAGVRGSKNQQDDYYPSSGLLAGGASVASGSSSDHSVTYLVTPKYEFDDHTMVYARVASGYRPGGPNDTLAALVAVGVPATYKPDTLTNYELGYKASLLDRQLTLDLSLFDIEWRHIQIGEIIGGVYTTGNGSNARSDGLEATVTWAPLRGLNLSANLAYTNARLSDAAPGVNGVSGDRLPDTPRFAANVNSDYDFNITNGILGFVGASYHYQGSRVTDFVGGSPPGYERPVLPFYQTVDLRTGVDKGGWEVEFYVKNVGDSHGLNYLEAINLDGISPPWLGTLIQPRTFGISIRDKF